MKALLLRVGIDKGTGGCLAPILQDDSFEFIPIPEERGSREDRRYRHLLTESNVSFVNFLPQKLFDATPHFDPEFETFTYGDPTQNKSRQLARLCPDDLLVFYAGLDPYNAYDKPRLYIIGYFTVEQAFDFSRISKRERKSILRQLRNNAHAKRKSPDRGLVIVKGDSQKSRLLSKALPLGDRRNCVLRDLVSIMGFDGSILRAIGHWVDDSSIPGLAKYLNYGVSALISDQTVLYSYVLKKDRGFAPNVTDGYCTLACCKPEIRRLAREGDWVIGTLPKKLGRLRLGYVMRVNEALSFDKYFNDERFQRKKPDNDPNGDNIYHKQSGKFVQLNNNHHKQEDMRRDTRVDKVLIGCLFWYFGDQAPEMPPRFGSLIKTGPGHKSTSIPPSARRSFVSWLTSQYRPGVQGKPRDTDTNLSRYSESARYTEAG